MSIEQQRNMMGNLKRFDRADHNAHDSKGKDAMLVYLNKKLEKYGLKTIENPNEYGIDLLTLDKKDIVVHCWEVEVRSGNWQGDVPFPFRDINCIERKDYQWRKDSEFIKKIPFELSNDATVCYVQLNKECTRAVMIDGNVILRYPLKQWANRKAEGEYVRQVPLSKTVQVKL